MKEEEFIDLCENLHDEIIKKLNKNTHQKGNIDFNEIAIANTVSEIIDSSHGYIDTKNKKIEKLFDEIFSLAATINQCLYFSSYYRAEMRRNIDESDSKFENIASSYLVARNILRQTYENIVVKTEKVLNIEKEKSR